MFSNRTCEEDYASLLVKYEGLNNCVTNCALRVNGDDPDSGMLCVMDCLIKPENMEVDTPSHVKEEEVTFREVPYGVSDFDLPGLGERLVSSKLDVPDEELFAMFRHASTWGWTWCKSCKSS